MTEALAMRNERARVSALAMANRFGRYKPMDEKTVRKIEVVGDELSYRRQRREMLRSMTPEQALQVIEFHKGLNVFEGLALAKRERKLIVPNDFNDRILTETDYGIDISLTSGAWTGTAVIYEKPDSNLNSTFKDKVVHTWQDDNNNLHYSISFEVPRQFRGKTNCALVIDHPDFEFLPLGNNHFELRAAEGHIRLFENFPVSSNWYSCDKDFRIPMEHNGVSARSDGVTPRNLSRLNGSYVGLIARAFIWGTYGRNGVYINIQPSKARGVMLF